MSPQTAAGRVPRALIASLQSDDRRGWLSQGLAALGVSALGLVVAGSMTLTTSAETTSGHPPARAAATRPEPGQVAGSGAAESSAQLPAAESSVSYTGALEAFVPPSGDENETPDQVRAAVVKERAAQRSEDLSKTAEDALRVTRNAGSKARANRLAATDREIRETAVRIATERRQRATALRVAAEVARKNAQAAAARAEAEARASRTSEAATQTSQQSSDGDPSSTGVERDSSPLSSSGKGYSPVPGGVIGTPFRATGLWARYHTGLDFRAAQGTPIRAVRSGVVLYAGNTGSWSGNHVAIMHAGGITTMSSHMSSMSVHAGQTVHAGQIIGRVGQTGRAFGAHLHFEVYPRGVRYGDIYRAINPVPWLRSNGVTTH